MNFDEMQNAWRSQDEPYKISIDASLLLAEVKRNQKYFAAMILGRDVSECAAALLMTVFFAFVGAKTHFHSLYCVALASAWVGLFLLIDRLIQRCRRKSNDASLLDAIETSIQSISHQIWLLDNVLWWYLLPPAASILFFYSVLLSMIVSAQKGSELAFGVFVVASGILLALFIFIWVYSLNKAAVRNELIPRKGELEKLRENLLNLPI